jgi:ferredoxin-NADP reductase
VIDATGPRLLRAPAAWQETALVAKHAETGSAATLAFSPEGWPGHRAGQHVDLRLTAEDGYRAQRSYSIASAPAGLGLELTVQRLDDGEVSPYLVDEMRSGDVLELRGPIGGWFVWDVEDGGPLQLIAGGSGLVPLMAMLRQRAAARSDVPARLLLSAKTADDLFYADELSGLASDSLQTTITLTRSAPPGWDGRAGRVDGAMLTETTFGPADRPRVYVCGPTAFVEAVAGALVDLGHDPRRVRTERFGPTGART